MAYLGAVPVDALFTVRVVWTPAIASPPVTGATLTLTHEDGDTVIGPLVADETAANSFEVAHIAVPRGGRWRAKWLTTPAGGVTSDVIYAE